MPAPYQIYFGAKSEQEKRCGKKVRYATLALAQEKAIKMTTHYGRKMNAYHCEYCGQHHIGRRKK